MTQQVFTAISKVSDILRKEGISKNKRCQGGGNFAYRGIDDVYSALSPALIDSHLVIAPTKIDKEGDAIAGKMRLVRLAITYTITCTDDGSSISVMSLGEGADTSDKAVGKAMSYAYKTLMFQLFCIPVQGQEDADSEVVDVKEDFIDESLANEAKEAAMGGLECYKKFFAELEPADRKALNAAGLHEKYKKIASESD